MATKKYDIAVKTGEYTDNTGAKKGRWQNVGAVMSNDDGSQYIMLAKWFNPAGVPDLSGKNAQSESILLSLFEPKERGAPGKPEGKPDAHNQAKANGYQPEAKGSGFDDMDDDIPF